MSMIAVPDIIFPPVRGTVAVTSRTLDAAEEFVVCVLKIKETGTLNKIVWQTGTVSGSSYTLKISVETVGTTAVSVVTSVP